MTCSSGVAPGCCTDRSILDVLDAVREGGIDAVELGTPPRHFDPWQQTQVDAVRARLSALRITPVSIHAPFGGLLDLSNPHPRGRHTAINGILTAASALKSLGGSIVVVHATDVSRDREDVEQRLANCVASLSTLSRACQHMSLALAIESPLPHLIGGHPDEFAWILQHVDSHAGVCLDTGHTTLGGQWERFLEIAGDRLIHVHANDHQGQFDDHLAPGDGIIDWKAIGTGLRQKPYRGWVMLELRCPDGVLPAQLARARAQTEALLG
jgi:sugar phosphate isomerase/epimerase